MKKTFRDKVVPFVVIALWVIIAFTMTSCESIVEEDFVSVESITGVPKTGTIGELTLTGTVNPSNATNKKIEWSVQAARTTGASISGDILTVTSPGSVMIKATIANGSGEGRDYLETFDITISIGEHNLVSLSSGIWVDGNLTDSAIENWYSFPVTEGSSYRVWWNDRSLGTNTSIKTGNVAVAAQYENSSSFIFGSGDTNVSQGWSTPQLFTASSTGRVFVRVISYNRSSDNIGTYTIVYTENSSARPNALAGTVTINGIVKVGETLTADISDLNVTGTYTYQWKHGNTPASVDTSIGTNESTYTLTATDTDKYITVTCSNIFGSVTSEAKGKIERDKSLASYLAWLKNNAQSGNNYTYTVTEDEYITPHDYYTLSYTDKDNITILFTGGDTEKTVSLSSEGSLFTVDAGVTLILGNNITLKGYSNNYTAIVRVNDCGTFIMQEGAKIADNTINEVFGIDSYHGGGVFVSTGGSFTMCGGEISGNTISSQMYARGSGVYIDDDGVFTMENGKIINNIEGGGVYLGTGEPFIMKNGIISGNTSYWGYGGIFTYRNFIMENGDISNNDLGVSFSNVTVTMKNGKISGNNGIGIFGDGTFIMENGEISNNSAEGVYFSGTFTMQDGKIIGNNNGGVNMNGTFTLEDGEISGNTSKRGGGGVLVGGTFTMKGGKISENIANDIVNSFNDSYGGGVHVRGVFTMSGGIITNNSVFGNGGGVSNYDGSFTMSGGEIINNTATGSGGGVNNDGGTFTMSGGIISGNTAGYNGGGLYNGYDLYNLYPDITSTFTMSGGTISGNTASGDGGGVYDYRGTFIMSGGTISGNTASGDGGGVYDYRGTFTMSGGTISGNTSFNGGGVYIFNGSFTMSNGIISGNTASKYGGGVYVYTDDLSSFNKTSGTIYGYGAGVNSNTATNGIVANNCGHAVFIDSSPAKRRETSAGPSVNLKYDGTVNPPVISGAWEDE